MSDDNHVMAMRVQAALEQRAEEAEKERYVVSEAWEKDRDFAAHIIDELRGTLATTVAQRDSCAKLLLELHGSMLLHDHWAQDGTPEDWARQVKERFTRVVRERDEARAKFDEYRNAALALARPCYRLLPRLSIDGDQWCALHGDNLMEGVSGFGESPEAAYAAFDVAWMTALSNKKTAAEERAAWKKRLLAALPNETKQDECGGTYYNGPDKRFARCDRCHCLDYEKNEGDKCNRITIEK